MMAADFGSSQELSPSTSDARPSARPERFQSEFLTRLDMSDDGNLKDAESELRRAITGPDLAAWARKWGQALCRAVPEGADKADGAEAEIKELEEENANFERDLRKADEELEAIGRVLDSEAAPICDGDRELSLAERLQGLIRDLENEAK